MGKPAWLILGLLVSGLMGCDDKTPPDKLTEQVVRPYAEQSLLKGMEMVDYKRDNGWVDSNSPNLYIVKYTLNYQLTKPLGEVVLENAKDYEKEFSDLDKKGDASMFSGGLNTLAVMMAVNQWVAQQGDSFQARKEQLLNSCQPCIAYWNSEDGGEKSVKNRRQAFLASMYAVEEAGFKESAKQGDKAPRWAQASFTKTEKGWEAAR